MNRKTASFLLVLILLASFFMACSPKTIAEEPSQNGVRDYTAFFGKTIGVTLGGVSDLVTQNQMAAKSAYYTELSAGIEDVRKGRIDGFMTDLSTLRIIAGSEGNEDMECLEIPTDFHKGPMGAISNDQDIIGRFNIFLAELEADGTLEDMQNRWLSTIPDLDSPMPDIPLTGEYGTLKVATCGEKLPFSYVGANGQLKGYSVELALRFARREGMNVEFAEMEFSGLIPYIISGKADLGIANISITEERKKSVQFTDPIYEDQLGIITLKAGGEKATNNGSGMVYTDFEGKKIGVATGTIWDQLTEDGVKGVPVYYSDMSAAIEDVRKSRIDGYMCDLSEARVFTAQPDMDDLEAIEIPSGMFAAPMGAISNNQDIIDRFNVFLAEIKADGTLAEMQTRWLKNIPDLDSSMPDIALTGENGTLKASTSGTALPFSYTGGDNELKGYSIELAIRFAAHEGMDIKFSTVDYSGFISYVAAGKTDIYIEAVSITEERKKSVLFTDSIYDDQAAIIALKQDNTRAANTSSFIDWLGNGIESNLITDSRWKLIVDGIGVTMTISFAAQIFGTLFGCVVCFVLTRKNKFAKWIGDLYCGLIHGTPMVVLLMITYYIIFGDSDISGVAVAIVAFTMVEGAIIAQTLKGAIDTVDPVEIEAARSIGFSAFRAFLTVTLPQAVRRALPSYTNGFVELVKSTAIVGYIAIQDLTRAGDIIRSRTYDAYFPLLLIAVIYLLVTAVCVQIFRLIVKKINGGEAK